MSGARILVVDDNATNLKLLSYLLSSRGYEVRAAGTAERAMEVMESFSPRVILLDIQLPGIDGLTMARRLRAEESTRDVTIIAVTAYAMKGDEERALAAGCDGYITKPIDTRALPGIVEDHLAGCAGGKGDGA